MMKSVNYERRKAVAEAWKKESVLVKRGSGTRDWSQKEQREILAKGKAAGYQGHHMKSVDGHNSKAGDASNIQFLTREEHLAAHNGNYRNNTNGYYDPNTGKMLSFGRGKAHVNSNSLSKPLTEAQKNAILSRDKVASSTQSKKISQSASAKAKGNRRRTVNKTRSSTKASARTKEGVRSRTLSLQHSSKPMAPRSIKTGSKTLAAQRSSASARSPSAASGLSNGKSASGGRGTATSKSASHGH